MHKAVKRIINYSFLIAVLNFGSCTPDIGYNVLRFIFDGVPDLIETQETFLADTINQIDSITNNELDVITEKSKSSIHQPYLDKKCGDCHDQNNMGKFLSSFPELCYTCHENLEDEYNYLHGPVAGGSCTACHLPHTSKFEKLLVLSEKDLCLDCHNSEDVFSNYMHDGFEDYNCLTCHNPHGGANRFVLQTESCFECHEDFRKNYKYVHGPAASGNCSTCHGVHKSESVNLLLREGQDLCLTCHEKEQVFKNEIHADIEDLSCLECHNPHGGDDKFMFN